jgi:predicted DNA-binding transcriptional regulator YafY
MSAPELAAKLEVSVRTIYRDVDALSSAGVPVYAEAGYRGGIRLLEDYRTRLTGLSADEAQALLMGGVPSAVAQLGLGRALVAAQAKVLAELPPALRAAATETRQRFHVDLPRWFATGSTPPALATVAGAVWANRRLQFRYPHDDGERARAADPLGVVLKAGRWYLVARVEEQLRVYRVDRVRRAVVTGVAFDRPADFDLEAFWDQRSAEFEASLPVVFVTVMVAPDAVDRLRSLVDHRTVSNTDWRGNGARRTRRKLEVGFEDLDQARAALLSLGPSIEVVEPTRLRDELAIAARQVVEIYDSERVLRSRGSRGAQA